MNDCRYRALWAGLVLLIGLLPAVCGAQSVCRLPAQFERLPLRTHAMALPLPLGPGAEEGGVSLPRLPWEGEGGFRPLSRQEPFVRGWLSLRLENPHAHPFEGVLRLGDLVVGYAEVYLRPEGQQAYAHQRTGLLLPGVAKSLMGDMADVPVTIEAGQRLEVLVYCDNTAANAAVPLSPELLDGRYWFVDSATNLLGISSFQGILLLLMCSALLVWVLSRQSLFLYVAAYLLANLLLLDVYLRGGDYADFRQYPTLVYQLLLFFTGMVWMLLMAVLLKGYASWDRPDRVVRQGLQVGFGISVVGVVASAVVFELTGRIAPAIQVFFGLRFLLLLLLLGLGVRCFRHGGKTLRMSAWSVTGVWACGFLAPLVSSRVSFMLLELGVIVQAAISILIVIRHMRKVQRQREDLLYTQMQVAQERTLLRQQDNQALEQAVTERSEQVRRQNETLRQQQQELVSISEQLQDRNEALWVNQKELGQRQQEVERQQQEIERRNHSLSEALEGVRFQQLRGQEAMQAAAAAQRALLPSQRHFVQELPEAFLLQRSSQPVHEYFTWLLVQDGYVFLALVGAQVEGLSASFLSLLVHTQLTAIVQDRRLLSPPDILDALGYMLVSDIGEEQARTISVSLCRFRLHAQGGAQLHYAGRNGHLLCMGHGGPEWLGGAYSAPLLSRTFELPAGSMCYLPGPALARNHGQRLLQLAVQLHALPASRQREQMEQALGGLDLPDLLLLGIRV